MIALSRCPEKCLQKGTPSENTSTENEEWAG